MYRCGNCNILVEFEGETDPSKPSKKTSGKLKSALKIVTKTRPKVYKNKIKRGKKITTFTSEGWEIVEELKVCRTCYKALGGE